MRMTFALSMATAPDRCTGTFILSRTEADSCIMLITMKQEGDTSDFETRLENSAKRTSPQQPLLAARPMQPFHHFFATQELMHQKRIRSTRVNTDK